MFSDDKKEKSPSTTQAALCDVVSNVSEFYCKHINPPGGSFRVKSGLTQ